MRVEANAAALHEAKRSLRRAQLELARMPVARRAEAIAAVARGLLEPANAHASALRDDLLAGSGLTAPAIEFGLRTTLALFERDALIELHAQHAREHAAHAGKLCVAVLAGNVFSAAARPLFFPLLCGHALLAKTASADAALPHAFELALHAFEPGLARAFAVTSFAREERTLAAALFADAEIVSIYGGDDTIAELRALAPSRARVIAHGHGGGAIAIAAESLSDASKARELAARAALDVAAYDQRGCLSPQAVLVERGAPVSAREFARLLADALAAIELQLPCGALTSAAAAEQTQWRGVTAALFEPYASAEARACVSYEHDAALRGCPGYRNVSVYEVASLGEARARLLSLGKRLKALAVAGHSAERELAELAPYVCALGAMQTPPLHARLDALDPLEGYD